MAGRPGRSGGHNRIATAQHLVRGTFATRQKAQAALETGVAIWTPTGAQEAALGADGRALVERLRAHFDLNPWEGELVLEAAIAVDRLAQIRRERDGCDLKARLALDKCEQLWQKQLSGLLLSLRVRP